MRRRLAPLLCGLLLLASGCGSGPERPRSAILVTLDTTRRDALSCAGAREGLTPALDAIAAESVRYAWARTVAPMTLPAHASMLTGLYPLRHGVRGNGPMVLPSSATTVAEAASAAGIDTAAFVGALALDRAYGIAQGFETYDQPEPWSERFDGQISERPASEVVDDALHWLGGRDRSRPFFLWVHVFDAHAPYVPEQRYLWQAGGDAYLGEVAAVDAALRRLFDALRADGTLEEALLIVAGDHGEARGEHGEPTHGYLCYDSTLRVPLLVRHPDGARAGEVSDETVSVVDVAPTLLEALGLPLPTDLDGCSLLDAPVPADRGVYFECYAGWLHRGWSPIAGWADAGGKYLHSSAPEFYRPHDDPLEKESYLEAPDAGVGRYRRALAGLSQRPALPPDSTPVVDAQTLAAMASLGYAVTDNVTTPEPPPLAPSDRPAPQNSVAAERDYERALAYVRAGDLDQAIAILTGIIDANADDPLALGLLAQALLGRRRYAEAADVLQRRLRLPPEKIGLHLDLATCLKALGRPEEAREHELRSMELRIQVHTRRGELEEAERWRKTLEQARAEK